jgi:AraC-like DNA-binding protein
MTSDVEKFKKIYLENASYEKIASEFHISERTVQEIRKKLHLRQRQTKPTVTDEEFKLAYNDGLTYNQLHEKFNMSGNTIAKHAKELGLSRSRKPLTSIIPKLAKPEPEEDKPKNCVRIPPTLGEIRKKQLRETILRIEKANRTARNREED